MAANPNRISLRNLSPAQRNLAEENSIRMQRVIEDSLKVNVNPNAQQQKQEELLADVAARLASLKSAKEQADKNRKEEEDLAKALRESAEASKAAEEAAKAIKAAQQGAKAVRAPQQDSELLSILKASEETAKAEEMARAAKAYQQDMDLSSVLAESAINIDIGKGSSKQDLDLLRAIKEREEIANGIIPVQQDANLVGDPKEIEEQARAIVNIKNSNNNDDDENLEALSALALADKTAAAAPNLVNSVNAETGHRYRDPFVIQSIDWMQ